MHLRLFLTLSVLAAPGCVNAAPPPDLYFQRLTTVQGLSNNKVNCILQDSRGFIWFGTDDGLNRYDGQNFLVFNNKPGSPSGISGNIITDLHEDRAGILWIATADGGMTRYDYRLPPLSQFTQYRHSLADSNSIPDNIVNDILEDDQGYLWLATGTNAVLRFDKRTGRFRKPAQMRGTSNALRMSFDRSGILWVGRQGGGIMKIDPRTMIASTDQRYEDLYAKLPHAAVSSFYRDQANNLWFGSWDQVLYQQDAKTNSERQFTRQTGDLSFVNDEILSFAEDRSGFLWLGGRQTGLQLYDKTTGHFTSYRYDPSRDGTIADNRVNAIFMTREGIVFLGTSKGISISNPVQQQFSQVFLTRKPGPNNGPVTVYDFYQSTDHRLYIATSIGLFRREQGDHSLTHLPLTYKGHQLAVTKILREGDETVYLGTDFSLFIFNLRTQQLRLLPNTEKDKVVYNIINSRIVSIRRDSIDGHPVVLVSPYGHFIAYYDLATSEWVSRLDTIRNIVKHFNLTDNLVRKFYKTSDGTIWLATAKRGLGEWNPGQDPKVKYFRNEPGIPDGISNNDVFDLAEDRQNNLWVSTYGGGLHYFDRKTARFTHINGSNNLQEGLSLDASGNVWMISNGNLHRYDPIAKQYTSFDLPDIEKSGGVRGNLFRDQEGLMYMAGNNYFISFRPDALRRDRKKPEVVLTDFTIFNKSYSDLLFGGPVTLAHDQNYFSIGFSAPDYSPASPIRYAYKLQGFDNEWIEIGSRNFVPYSNLPAGDYTFLVKATNDPGTWSDKIASLRIRIIPPFWKTWWFYLLCTLGIGLAIFAIYRYRINEILKRQAIRNRIAQDLHDHLGSTISSVSVYSQVAQIHDEQGNRKMLKDVLQKISVTSTDMISDMSDIVWAINPGNDNMEKILQRMDSYAKPLLAAKGIVCHFTCGPDIAGINLPMETRKNFYLIYKEAINNALKYSACQNVDVRVSRQSHQMELEITDDGSGFDPGTVAGNASKSLSGNGLWNMRSRTKEMKGELVVTSSPGQGTRIRLNFPLT